MNRFVQLNVDNCIGCRACEIACVMAHNQGKYVQLSSQFLPRIHMIDIAGKHLPLVCHQCEDAPCVKVCPSAALMHSGDYIHINEKNCIGCRACVDVCPFGAIDIQSQMYLNTASTTYHKPVPLKCDLCEGVAESPSCVASCPSNALHLIEQKQAQDLDYERKVHAQLHHELDEPQPVEEAINEHPMSESESGKVYQMLHTAARKDPEKKPIELRKHTFIEIYPTFTPEQAVESAKRCLFCGSHSVCEWVCPLHNRIPHWVSLAKQGRILEAVELSHYTNCLPEITGRVCPQDRLCEGACTLKEVHGSMTVGGIERYVTDEAFKLGWRPDLSYVKPTDKKVAIVGAGPAGLACADILARNGVQAVVFDLYPEIGGLLTFGIPPFKLDKSILQHRREVFSGMGIQFHLNTEVGKDVSMQSLLDDYDAIFIGVGTYKSMTAGLKNEDADGVYAALPFLIASTRKVMGIDEDPKMPYLNMADKRVVVLGGGDTAMDCVRTSIRQQATEVTCAYRRDERNMPGSKKEVKNAREEGVQFEFNVTPLQIELDETTEKVNGISMVRTAMGARDASGRQRPEPIPDSEFVMPADAIIVAFGFSPHEKPWLEEMGVKSNNWGGIIAPAQARYPYQTTNEKIFAGGDAVRGADLVVTAIMEGRMAAQGMMKYMNVVEQRPVVEPPVVNVAIAEAV